MLSWLYRAEYTHGYQSRGPIRWTARWTAARRAVNLAPSNQLAHAALASAYFFRRELGRFAPRPSAPWRSTAWRDTPPLSSGCISPIPATGSAAAHLAERATQLNPNHPGWYWLPLVMNAYRQHDGELALRHALKINMPGLWTAQVALAVVNSQLGKMDQSRSAVRDLLAARPDFAAHAREDLSIWWQPDMVEQMLGDLRKAGPDSVGSSSLAADIIPFQFRRRPPRETRRADEGFWVAVLPFKYAGSKRGSESSGRRIVGRNHHRTVALLLPARDRPRFDREIFQRNRRHPRDRQGTWRALCDGRQPAAGGSKAAARRAACRRNDRCPSLGRELTNAPSTPEDIFALQDDLVPRIVSTVADQYGILPRSMSEALRSKRR